MKTKIMICMLIGCLLTQAGLCDTREGTLVCDEATRTYRIHVPKSFDGSQYVPLVLMLHGYSDSAVYMENQTGMNTLSDQYGFITVYPDGLPTGTGHNRQWTWGDYEVGSGDVNDASFVPALIGKLIEEFPINLSEIYAVGWSNGAFFTHHLGARMSDKFAAIAPCGGLLQAGDLIPGSPPVSVIIFNADNDSAVPYGGYPEYGYPSAEDGAALWAQQNNCDMTPQTIRDDNRISAWQYLAPGGDGDVAFYMLKGQGHRYANDDEVWASEIIWDFFDSHPKTGPEHAWNPNPADNEQDVDLSVGRLQWYAGEIDAQPYQTHHVYFGTVIDDVNNATVPLEVLTGANELALEPLEYDTTYYWRVDEVGDAGQVTRGPLWQFTTRNHLVVDSFETYTDAEPNKIGDIWTDGQGLETNGAVIGGTNPDITAHLHYVQPSLTFDGTQSMSVLYDNSTGISEVVRPLDADWTQDHVDTLSIRFKGFSGVSGGFTETPEGTFTVQGRGRDIYDVADQFHFVYKEISGNATIIAKVERIDNTDPWAKAGVMIRDTLEPGAQSAVLFITPERSGRLHIRMAEGSYTDILYMDEVVAAPYWIKLGFSLGSLVKAYYGEDGENWNRLFTTVPMSGPVYVGLAVTSHNADVLCEAEFSNVTLTGTGSDQAWSDQDIGLITNDAQPIYVTVNNTATVTYEGPNTIQNEEWTEWRIPLQSFTDKGVDLSQVHSIGLGIGNRDNPQPGGTGVVSFDAVRLYRP